MKRLIGWMFALVLVVTMGAGAALAQAADVTGTWQGTLKLPNGKDLRIVLQIAKDDGKLRTKFYSIDQGAQPLAASSTVLDGQTLTINVDIIGGKYVAKMAPDGKSMTGTWTQGDGIPLDLVKPTKEAAWEIPAPPPPPKLMAADANPAFDVATIKPNDKATSMQRLTVNGRNFNITGGSLEDMMGFAYQVQSRQVVNPPSWFTSDRYDIAAVPDHEGAPNPEQVRMMVRKLLEERFALKVHHEKREMPAFVMTVSKSGSKLQPTQLKGPLPGFGFGPAQGGMTMRVMNSTMDEFKGFLQGALLDRPVVDDTGLKGNYDFHVTFTPDDSMFHGRLPFQKPADASAEAAPSFFEAITSETGLKLSPEKAPVDVIVIDHVEKPSAN